LFSLLANAGTVGVSLISVDSPFQICIAHRKNEFVWCFVFEWPEWGIRNLLFRVVVRWLWSTLLVLCKSLKVYSVLDGTDPKKPQTRKAHTKKAANLKGLTKAMFCKWYVWELHTVCSRSLLFPVSEDAAEKLWNNMKYYKRILNYI